MQDPNFSIKRDGTKITVTPVECGNRRATRAAKKYRKLHFSLIHIFTYFLHILLIDAKVKKNGRKFFGINSVILMKFCTLQFLNFTVRKKNAVLLVFN